MTPAQAWYLNRTNYCHMKLDYIGKDLNGTAAQTWVPNALSLVQAVIAPIISSASDTFQARKLLLVCPAILSFIGSAIAPGSTTIYRVIGAQILIGFGFATVPLAYVVPSEILPRKWRPSKSTVRIREIPKLYLKKLRLMTRSGTSIDERRRFSRFLRGTIDHRCSDQGKPSHRLAQVLRQSLPSYKCIP
jgi:hypothetical protein